MAANAKYPILSIVLILALLGTGVGWCWRIRETPEKLREARRETTKQVKTLPADDVVPYLKKLSEDRFFVIRFDNRIPFLHAAFETRVDADFIAQLAEDAFLRFAGNKGPGGEDVPHIRAMIDFTRAFLPQGLTPVAANALRDRLLDGYFLANDFAGAIALLEEDPTGFSGHTAGWCKGTAAKLRYHLALEKGDKKEACKQLLVFGAFMLSKEMDDFEDCDPTTQIIYSRDWVVARNYMRCANLSQETGDAAKAAEYRTAAGPYFKTALEKAKDDEKSLDALKKEMKSFGL